MYAVTKDGQRFLVHARPENAATAAPVTVIVNLDLDVAEIDVHGAARHDRRDRASKRRLSAARETWTPRTPSERGIDVVKVHR